MHIASRAIGNGVRARSNKPLTAHSRRFNLPSLDSDLDLPLGSQDRFGGSEHGKTRSNNRGQCRHS